MFKHIDPQDWANWGWHLRNRISKIEDLKQLTTIDPAEEEGIIKCLAEFRMAITPYYFSLIDLDNPNDPIRKQSIPSGLETKHHAEDLDDPLHEDTDSLVKGLTHRYPDRALLLITDQCSMYCRFCTRRRFAGNVSKKITTRRAYSDFNYGT